MTIQCKQEDNVTVLFVEGRVDSNSSGELQEKIADVLQNAQELILDFQEVAYISSAGLRVLLIGHKTASSKNAKMSLRNVSELVMQVLETVGFAKILSFQ